MPQPEISLNRGKDVPPALMIETGQRNYLRPGIHVFIPGEAKEEEEHAVYMSQQN